MANDTTSQELAGLLRPVVEGHGLTLWGVELTSADKGRALRVYVEGPEGAQGVNVDLLAAVSRDASVLLDVEDPIAGRYNLEVSTPGLERPFFTAGQLAGFEGRGVAVRLAEPLPSGRKNFKGVLLGVDQETVAIESDGETFEFPFSDVARISLRITDWAAVQKAAKSGRRAD